MKYRLFTASKNDTGTCLFEKVQVNAARRDLIKQLAALGTVGPLLSSPLGFAATQSSTKQASLNGATWRKDEKYEELRQSLIWRPNTPPRYPDVMVHARTEEQIVHALKFAQANKLQVITRSSGHNIHTLRNGGMLLDISSMGELTIDKKAMQASAQPGLIMYYFYEQIAQQGFIFPVADCYTVALGGYLLGGGYAALGYNWGDGPACYSILGADVILADGTKVTANSEENPDLYWALRGMGPGFFGVVTRYQLQLYRQPELIMQNSYSYSTDSLPKIISFLDALKDRKSVKTQVSVSLNREAGLAKPLIVKLTIRAIGRDKAEVKSLLSLYSRDDLIAEAIAKNEFQQVTFGELMYNPSRSDHNLSDNIWTDDASSISAIVEHCKNMPAHNAFIATLFHSRQIQAHRKDACYSVKGAHCMSSHLFWNDTKDDVSSELWYTELNAILKPYATGHYVSQMESQNQSERIKDCFSPENWQRLAELRQKYDPDGQFFGYIEGV